MGSYEGAFPSRFPWYLFFLYQSSPFSPRVTVLLIDPETSERYAVIRKYLRVKGIPIPTNDLWITASAMQFGLKVLTTDRHFLKVSQIITEILNSPRG
jgi:predicted nucleic acid-binding protein